MQHPDTSIELPEPWFWTNDDMSVQLKWEVGKRHVLYGKNVRTLARRYDQDDFLFALDGGTFA